MESLKHQVAVVTGASSGIGKAICLALAKEGVTVCLLGRNIEKLNKIKDLIKLSSPLAKVFKVDLVDDDEVVRATKLIRNEFGKVDILVHSAGVTLWGRFKISIDSTA